MQNKTPQQLLEEGWQDVTNPNYSNKKVDYYFDIDGNPVGKGSKASHIVIVGD